MAVTILAVDDEPRWRQRLVQQIGKCTPTKVITATGPDDAFTQLSSNPTIGVVLLDQDLEVGGEGSDLCARLRDRVGMSKIIIGVSSSSNPVDVKKFRDAGADGFASKAGFRLGLNQALSYPSIGLLIPRSFVHLFENPMGFVAERILEPLDVAGSVHLPPDARPFHNH